MNMAQPIGKLHFNMIKNQTVGKFQSTVSHGYLNHKYLGMRVVYFRINMNEILSFHYCSLPTVIHICASLLSRSWSIIMNGKEVKHCSLCFHNGEPEEFYR